MNGFDMVDLLLLYINKEEATEYTGMRMAPGWGGPASLHEGAANQDRVAGRARAPCHCFYHA